MSSRPSGSIKKECPTGPRALASLYRPASCPPNGPRSQGFRDLGPPAAARCPVSVEFGGGGPAPADVGVSWGGVGLARRARGPVLHAGGARLARRRSWRAGAVWRGGAVGGAARLARRAQGPRAADGGAAFRWRRGAVCRTACPPNAAVSVAWRPASRRKCDIRPPGRKLCATSSADTGFRGRRLPVARTTDAFGPPNAVVPGRLSPRKRPKYGIRQPGRKVCATRQPTPGSAVADCPSVADRRVRAAQRCSSRRLSPSKRPQVRHSADPEMRSIQAGGKRGVRPGEQQPIASADQPRGDRPSRPRRPGGSDRTTSIALVAIRNRRVSGTLPRRSGRWRRRHPCTAGTKFRR